MPTIYQLPTQVPGMVDVLPNQKFAVFGDDLTAVTTAGYLNQAALESNPLSNNDIIQALYSYNQQSKSGTYGIFTVSISNLGVITLNAWANPGEVVLPTIANNWAMFTNTSGTLGNILKANGTEATNAVTASGKAGVITTSALTTVAGGSYAITWTNTQIAAASAIQLTLMGGTNTIKDITLQATAGAGTSTLTIYNNDGVAALDGTLFIAYQVV